MKDAAASEIIPSHLGTRAHDFVAERNWFVHRLVHESGDDLYTDEGRERVFRRVEAIATEAVELRKVLAAEMDRWCNEQEWTPKRLSESPRLKSGNCVEANLRLQRTALRAAAEPPGRWADRRESI